MDKAIKIYTRITLWVSGKIPTGLALLLVRVALAGVFWRSGRTKLADGSWFHLSENALYQFSDEPFNHVPLLSPSIAAHLSLFAETAFPILLVIGLATRLSALALCGMTLVIQIFVFPDAWWSVHSLWMALGLTLITRGAGYFSLDHIFGNRK